jgi:ATP/maltotriose-dependent transcriptional regulator MalT
MSTPILATKLYIPPPRPNVVQRPRLFEQLNEGLQRKLTLISAPAGFGKTTLLSEWLAERQKVKGKTQNNPDDTLLPFTFYLLPSQVAWLSLDEADNDPTRFLAYLVAALQTIAANIGAGVLGALQSPQPPPTEAILTALLNDITTVPGNFALVLDDYHVIDSKSIDTALTFLLEHLPPHLHLVIATREDPDLPLARLRARGQMTELRAADLRFTAAEAADFLNLVMGLKLSAEDITALEERTEGWIAGLQLAAISLQGQKDATRFIKSFTGSHHFVLDYLVEEVLHQQPESVQMFLLRTSILDRLCGPLCDAVLLDPAASGQATLEYLEHANLFIIPLDNERHWYRYHHLFADLLRQRLHQSIASSIRDAESRMNELHTRASQWYEDNRLEIEAFHHAAAANDLERAERLMEGKGIPLHFRGAVITILDWLESLPTTVLNARPSLWWRYASLLLVNGQTTGVEEKLDAAEAALQGAEADDKTRNLIGRIAAARAVLALTRYQAETMLAQSRRALSYLDPNNLSTRANAHWTLGVAYLFQGDRAAARRALTEAIALSQAAGDIFTTILATIGLGNVQEAENQLYLAAETYQRVLQLAGDQPLQIIYEAHLGMARILYEWNDLDAAERYGRQSLHLARQYDRVIDRFILCEVFLARLKLAQGDLAGAAAILAQADQSARQQNFVYRIPEVAAAQVLTLLRQGNLAAAAHLAQTHGLPLSQARIHLAQGDTSAALAVLEPFRRQVEAKDWQDERLKVVVLQAVAHHLHGEKDKAVHLLGDALALAAPGGFIRLFIDEGFPMAQLLSEASAQGMMPDYIGKLLAVFEAEKQRSADNSRLPPAQPLIEPLSQRELEVLRLIAQGLSNREISERLFLALVTVKVHNQKIFGKLHVQRRTEAVARARELGLL